jgi:hypothetical protein
VQIPSPWGLRLLNYLDTGGRPDASSGRLDGLPLAALLVLSNFSLCPRENEPLVPTIGNSEKENSCSYSTQTRRLIYNFSRIPKASRPPLIPINRPINIEERDTATWSKFSKILLEELKMSNHGKRPSQQHHERLKPFVGY